MPPNPICELRTAISSPHASQGLDGSRASRGEDGREPGHSPTRGVSSAHLSRARAPRALLRTARDPTLPPHRRTVLDDFTLTPARVRGPRGAALGRRSSGNQGVRGAFQTPPEAFQGRSRAVQADPHAFFVHLEATNAPLHVVRQHRAPTIRPFSRAAHEGDCRSCAACSRPSATVEPRSGNDRSM